MLLCDGCADSYDPENTQTDCFVLRCANSMLDKSALSGALYFLVFLN